MNGTIPAQSSSTGSCRISAERAFEMMMADSLQLYVRETMFDSLRIARDSLTADYMDSVVTAYMDSLSFLAARFDQCGLRGFAQEQASRSGDIRTRFTGLSGHEI